jgi:multidrug efflux pump subunit AcrA (membrane-fusion protein)
MRLRARRQAAGAIVLAAGLATAVVLLVTRGDGTVPVSATTATVQRGTVTAAVSAAGTVQAAQTRGLGFSTTGTVTELSVRAGDLVTAGQVLARIDPADSQAAVDTASARVDDAQTAVTKAQQTAALPLCPTATPPPSVSSGPRGGGGGGANPTPTCRSARTTTSDQLLAAEQQLNNARLALTQANARLAGTVITAPIAGRVLSVGGAVGSRASAGGTGFIVLGDLSTLGVSAQFTEADIGRLAVGQVAAVTLPGRGPVAGKVSQIDPAGTVTNRLVRYGVVIGFDQVPGDLLLGQSATVVVTTATADNVLFVASAAVVPAADGTASVTVRTEGRDEARTVRVGLRGDQYTEISSGLAEGDVVVLPVSP